MIHRLFDAVENTDWDERILTADERTKLWQYTALACLGAFVAAWIIYIREDAIHTLKRAGDIILKDLKLPHG